MSTITSGTTSGQAIVFSGDTTGDLVFKTNNGTTALTATGANVTIAGTLTATGGMTGTLGVANGGTGATTLPANNVLIGNGTSAVGAVAPGTAGNLLTSNGTTWTSAPAPASGTFDAIATGSLSNGSTVVINADGTVSVVGPVITPVPSVGAAFVFNASATSRVSSTYDSVNQKVVIFYRDASANGFVNVGTVSGSTITFGVTALFNSGDVGATACAYDANAQKIVVAYKDDANSTFGTARVGTVSGTNISFGTAVVFQGSFGIGATLSVVYDATAQKVVIAYIDSGGNQGRAIVGTVTGTNISFGTNVQFSTSVSDISSAYDNNAQKVVIAFRDGSNSNFGTAIVGTVSGTSISFGTAVVYNSFLTSETSTVCDASALKVVIAYKNNGNSSFGTAIVGTVSGTSISFGTAVVFASVGITRLSSAYDASVQKIVISFAGTSNFGNAILGIVSGTSISFSTPVVFNSASTAFIASTYDAAAQKVVTSYQDGGNSARGTSVVISSTTSTPNLTSENFIGFSSAAYTNGQTATIQLVGSVNTAQSSLTPGQSYFVLTDGTLNLTAGSPSVFAGTAVAATKIIVKG